MTQRVPRQNGQSLEVETLDNPVHQAPGMPNNGILPSFCSIFWRALCSSTMYRELSSAQGDEDFQRVRMRLKQEWIAIGALVSVTTNLTLLTVNT